MIAAVATGVAAAALAGLGFAVQQQAAATQPPGDALRLRLLLHLAKRRSWLLGLAAMIAGQLLGASALSQGGLGLVEPLLATNLLFALGVSAAWKRQRLLPREWIGAVVLAGALAGFVLVAAPNGGHVGHLPWPNWAISLSCVVAIAAAFVARSRRGGPNRAARNLGAAAGVMFGLQDALTRRTLAVLPHGGVVALLVQWPTYLLVAVGLCSLLLAQSAFEAAPLPESLPPMTFAEPVTGIAFGAGVYAEHLGLGAGALALETACLAAAAAGVWLVASSETLRGPDSPRDSRGEYPQESMRADAGGQGSPVGLGARPRRGDGPAGLPAGERR